MVRLASAGPGTTVPSGLNAFTLKNAFVSRTVNEQCKDKVRPKHKNKLYTSLVDITWQEGIVWGARMPGIDDLGLRSASDGCQMGIKCRRVTPRPSSDGRTAANNRQRLWPSWQLPAAAQLRELTAGKASVNCRLWSCR